MPCRHLTITWATSIPLLKHGVSDCLVPVEMKDVPRGETAGKVVWVEYCRTEKSSTELLNHLETSTIQPSAFLPKILLPAAFSRQQQRLDGDSESDSRETDTTPCRKVQLPFRKKGQTHAQIHADRSSRTTSQRGLKMSPVWIILDSSKLGNSISLSRKLKIQRQSTELSDMVVDDYLCL